MVNAIKQKLEVEIQIVEEKPDRYEIQANIPDISSQYPTQYIYWSKTIGDPPKVGAVVLAEMEPRAKTAKGKELFGDGPIDGTEEGYRVRWRMLGSEMLYNMDTKIATAPTNSGKGNPSTASSNGPLRASSGGTNSLNWYGSDLRWRAEQEMWFFKEAIKHVIEHGKLPEGSNLYSDIESVIKEADKIGTYLLKQFATRLDNHLVIDAMESGAVVTEIIEPEIVEPEPVITDPVDDLFPPDKEGRMPSGNLSPKIWKSMESFQEWIETNQEDDTMKWSTDQIRRVLKQKAGCKTKKAIPEYLAMEGKTLEGLAVLLDKELNW